MFSGQGSQHYQMGRALFEDNETFRTSMVRLDERVRNATGLSVIEAVYSDERSKSDPFDRTLLTHPAIFMVEVSLAEALIQEGVRPDMVLGASLGSFAAAAVAGCIETEDALMAVVRQAIALEESCEPGAMTAVLAERSLFDEQIFRGCSALAAVNFSSHFVVSARRAELEGIEAVLKRRKVGYQRLPVKFAFHSPWIDSARAPFVSFVRSVRRNPGRLPLVCCDQTAVLSGISEDYLWDVVRRPIRFPETVARLEEQGARRYIDAGPGGTLATFLKYTLPASTGSAVFPILTPFGTDRRNLAAVAAALTADS